MDEKRTTSRTYTTRVLTGDDTKLLERGHAIVLEPRMIGMTIDAIGLVRRLADAALKDANEQPRTVDGTRLDAVLGALLVELHALNNGTTSYGLQPHPDMLREDDGAQQPQNKHPLDRLLRHEAVAAYELLKYQGLKAKTEAMPIVTHAIRNQLSKSTILAIRKALKDQGLLGDVTAWFFGQTVKPPLLGAEPASADWMTTSAIKNRIIERLHFTADRYSSFQMQKRT